MKPIVTYDPAQGRHVFVGKPAVVTPIDHPTCSNTKPVITSRVISVEEDGSFETLNTRYVPIDDEESVQ